MHFAITTMKMLEYLGQQAQFRRVKFRIKSKILLLDYSTISLCLSLFDWAKYKTEKGAVKIQNAVLTQIWTTLILILVLKYLKQIAKHAWNLSNLVSFLMLNLFVKIDLQYWLDKPFT